MICPVCGSENPDGTVMCSICNSPLVSTPAQSYSAPVYSSTPSYTPAKKSSGGVAAIIGVVVAILAFLAVGFFGLGWRYNGTYEFDSVSAMGFTYSLEDYEALTGQKVTATMKVSFGKYSLNGSGIEGFTSGDGKIKFKGKNFTIDDQFDGYYDSATKSLVVESYGIKLNFKKK